MMGWIDTKRPPTFSVGGLTHGMGFSDFARERSAPADCFRCKVRWDSCYGSAREALPCTEQRDAKQPGLSSSGLSASQSARIQASACIEVRPLFQRDFILPRNSDVQCVLIYSDTNISHFLSINAKKSNGVSPEIL